MDVVGSDHKALYRYYEEHTKPHMVLVWPLVTDASGEPGRSSAAARRPDLSKRQTLAAFHLNLDQARHRERVVQVDRRNEGLPSRMLLSTLPMCRIAQEAYSVGLGYQPHFEAVLRYMILYHYYCCFFSRTYIIRPYVVVLEAPAVQLARCWLMGAL